MQQSSLMIGMEAFPEFTRALSRYAAISYREREGALLLCPLCWKGPEAWLHALYAPLSDAEITEIEQELGVALPPDYKRFLSIWNGATLFYCDLEMWGRVKPHVTPDLCPAFDVGRDNQILREHVPAFRTHLFGIASYSYGDVICLDLSDRTNTSAAVRVWDHEERQVTGERWSSLREWLAYEMQEGGEVWAPRLSEGIG